MICEEFFDLEFVISKINRNVEIVAFTQGVFDCLHVGHIKFLQEVKELECIVILALDSDERTKERKGLERPIQTWKQRAKKISDGNLVNYIFRKDKDSAYYLERIKPAIQIISSDNLPTLNKLLFLKNREIKLITLQRTPEISTTILVNYNRSTNNTPFK